MAPLQGALPGLRAATDPNAVSGAFYTPRWVNRGPLVRRPMLACTRSRDARATPWVDCPAERHSDPRPLSSAAWAPVAATVEPAAFR
jgi:hypothetical protein